jgi:HEAT repeat protein
MLGICYDNRSPPENGLIGRPFPRGCLQSRDRQCSCILARLRPQIQTLVQCIVLLGLITVSAHADEVDDHIHDLNDPDSEIRMNAAMELGMHNDSRSIDALSRAVHDKDHNVGYSALESLARLRAVDPLIQALQNDDWGIRAAAANELGNAQDKRAVGPLIRALKDGDRFVRSGAASSLGKLGDARAEAPLIQALKDEDGHVREVASEALGRLLSLPPEPS